MGDVNIMDLSTMVRGYMSSTIKEYYPDLDLSENSSFDDLFIKPLIKLITPIMDSVNRLELKSNLSNAEYLTSAELDEIGQGNYFLTRKAGSKASTMITIIFSNISIEIPNFRIKIPAGTIFATANGLQFETESAIILGKEDFEDNLNKVTMAYEIEIPVVASNVGSEYNVSAGEIIFLKSFISNSVISVTNKVDVTDGTDQESDEDYLKRIRTFYLSRQLGTAPGYKAFVLENCPEVVDVYVSGYRDKYMKRDILRVLDDDGQVVSRHVGGAVDLYLKGCNYEQKEINITLNNSVIILDCPISALPDQENLYNNIEIHNLTDLTKHPVIKSMIEVDLTPKTDDEDNDENSNDKDKRIKLILDNENEVSYKENIKNKMRLVYKYKNEDGVVNEQEMIFYTGLTLAELSSPVSSVNAIINPLGVTLENLDDRYELIKTGEPETSNENCTIKITNCDDCYNGMVLTVKYTVNSTLQTLKQLLDLEQNRIITADVISREAEAIPINLNFGVKLNSAYQNVDIELMKNRIKSAIISFFKNYKLGGSVQASDIVSWIYNYPSTKDIVDYIALPFKVFYKPNDISEEIPTDGTQFADNGVLEIESIEYPVLNVGKFNIDIL